MIKLAVAAAPATKPATTTSALALPELKGITIQTGAISPQQAFEELSTQSDVPFAVKSADVWLRAGPGSIGVDLKDAPFWVAMKTLCQLTNLIPQRSEENAEEIVLAPSEHNWLWGKNAPTCPTSVATFVIGNISESRQIKLHRPQKIDRSLNLTIDAFVDPRVRRYIEHNGLYQGDHL